MENCWKKKRKKSMIIITFSLWHLMHKIQEAIYCTYTRYKRRKKKLVSSFFTVWCFNWKHLICIIPSTSTSSLEDRSFDFFKWLIYNNFLLWIILHLQSIRQKIAKICLRWFSNKFINLSEIVLCVCYSFQCIFCFFVNQ